MESHELRFAQQLEERRNAKAQERLEADKNLSSIEGAVRLAMLANTHVQDESLERHRVEG